MKNSAKPNPLLPQSVPIKRTLRYKILFVVLPLFLIFFAFLGITVYFSINRSITNIAKEFIGYRLKEVADYSNAQIKPAEFTDSTRNAFYRIILDYASKFNDETFIIVPYEYNTNSNIVYTLNPDITINDITELHNIMHKQEEIRESNPEEYNSWISVVFQNTMVGVFLPDTETQSWYAFLADEADFYAPVTETMTYLVVIMVISIVILSVFILTFVNFITRPLNNCVNTIQSITESMDFSKRVRIIYPDEIGTLGQYFNDMIQELEKSYNQIKNYALQTVLSKQKEERIRFIFQKYVPSNVIDHVLNIATDSMLVGAKQKVTMLFSDIRDFTTISEQLPPEELVLSLNNYFTSMVEQVINHNGMIDKFIGDAIMAIFGAPAISPTSADDAVLSALLMEKELVTFNSKQAQQGLIQFEIGIGINTGEAIVGNIGSEQKLDYTVIGDAVNLGARLEGLTKSYKETILISEFVKESIQSPDKLFFINVDTVRVKGKKKPVVIFRPKLLSAMTPAELKFYEDYHKAQHYYYTGDFARSLQLFRRLSDSGVYLVSLYIERCEYLIANPPEVWEGIQTWTTK